MKKETEQFLTEQGLWNYADNIKLSRNSLAELLEKYAEKSRQAYVAKRNEMLHKFDEEFTETVICSGKTLSMADAIKTVKIKY
jgi:hypothetical protein